MPLERAHSASTTCATRMDPCSPRRASIWSQSRRRWATALCPRPAGIYTHVRRASKPRPLRAPSQQADRDHEVPAPGGATGHTQTGRLRRHRITSAFGHQPTRNQRAGRAVTPEVAGSSPVVPAPRSILIAGISSPFRYSRGLPVGFGVAVRSSTSVPARTLRFSLRVGSLARGRRDRSRRSPVRRRQPPSREISAEPHLSGPIGEPEAGWLAGTPIVPGAGVLAAAARLRNPPRTRGSGCAANQLPCRLCLRCHEDRRPPAHAMAASSQEHAVLRRLRRCRCRRAGLT
jgi:hypothetical protein